MTSSEKAVVLPRRAVFGSIVAQEESSIAVMVKSWICRHVDGADHNSSHIQQPNRVVLGRATVVIL